MVSVFRVMVCCLWCATAVLASSPTIEEILASEAVLDDFLDAYGDEPEQNALGAAKGVIENGKGKAYLGEGYWFAYDDGKTSTILNGAGMAVGSSNFGDAIDTATKCLHIKMTREDTSTSSYVGFGCNLVKEKTYVDLSKMTAFTISAKGTGSTRVNFITKDYVDEGEDWGYYGADIDLTSGDFTNISKSMSAIEPAEWSYGYKEDLTFAASGSKAVTKITARM